LQSLKDEQAKLEEEHRVLEASMNESTGALSEAQAQISRLDETLKAEVEAGLKTKAKSAETATAKEKEQTEKMQEMELCAENEKKVLKGQISQLEETLNAKDADAVQSSQALMKAQGEIDTLKHDRTNLQRSKVDVDAQLEQALQQNNNKNGEVADNVNGWNTLSSLLVQEESRSPPGKVGAQELYESLADGSVKQTAGWWSGEAWLPGVLRAISHLQEFESSMPRAQPGQEDEKLKLVLNMNINNMPPGSEARREFEAQFVHDIANALQAAPTRIVIASVTAGSVIVTFTITAAGPKEPSAASLRRTLSDMVLDRTSGLYQGAVSCFVDEQRSARSLTGLGMGELEAVLNAARPSYTTWASIADQPGERVQIDTEGLQAGKEYVERCAGVLTTRQADNTTMRKDLAMGEVVLRSVCAMHSRASSERDMVASQLRRTVHRAFGRAVLTWVERMRRDSMRYQYAIWRNVMKQREMDELRAQKKHSERRIEEENEKRAKLKKQALKVQSDNKALQEQQRRMQVEERAAMAATGRSLVLQSITHVENYFQVARNFFIEEHSSAYEQFKKDHPVKK